MKPRIVAKMALQTNGWVGLLENALLVGLAAGLTYASQRIGKEDFGQWTPAITAGATILLSYLNKVLANPVVPVPVVPPAPEPVPNPVPDHTSDHTHDFPIR